jgi:hypothetical protein
MVTRDNPDGGHDLGEKMVILAPLIRISQEIEVTQAIIHLTMERSKPTCNSMRRR